ncbi:MAG: acyltransferase [Ruminococcaceae bacterium]|nr:acyltransferase [Oscillospiraceae bacterium]
MKRIISLDVLKYIACFFVICIHMDIPNSAEIVLRPFLTTAVPIFFMITGFFYTQTRNAGNTKRQLGKIAILALTANAVHFGYYILKHVLNKESVSQLVAKIFAQDALIELFVFNQPVWRTSLWFINALLYVLLLVYLFEKKWQIYKLYPLIPVLLIFNLLGGTFSFALPTPVLPLCYSRNFLFCGLPYFLLGDFIFRNKKKMCSIFGKCRYIVLFSFAAYLELWILKNSDVLYYNDHLISTTFLTVCLFCLFLEKENGFKGRFLTTLSGLGRKHSFVIYITHSILIEILYKTISVAGKRFPAIQNVFIWTGPVIVLALSTLLAIALGSLKKKKT